MGTSLQVATVNVNGIRAAFKKDMAGWLEHRQPDVLLLQEVRAPDDVVEDLLGANDGDRDGGRWTLAHQACDIKGRAGVAVAAKYPATAVRVGLGESEEPIDTGRWVEMDLAVPGLDIPLTVVSVYIHSGTLTKPESMDAKYAHLKKATSRLAELAEDARAGMRHVLVGGDLNIVHTEADIKNWKPNHNKTAGVLDEEIAYLNTWFDELGYVDLGRRLAGEVQGPYTWWSQRGKAFDNDAGWRIDYQIVNPELAALATSAEVDRAESYDTRFSDHAPLVVHFAL